MEVSVHYLNSLNKLYNEQMLAKWEFLTEKKKNKIKNLNPYFSILTSILSQIL